MLEAEIESENYTQIEDIIDARKKLGQYNIYKQENSRYTCPNTERYVRFDDSIINTESTSNIKLTDSEVTIVRVKCDSSVFKRRNNSKWDIMNDIAIPGDGSHLGDSPSLVNLATLITRTTQNQNIPCEGDEYLVPLSSWDPYCKTEDMSSFKLEKTESEVTTKSAEKSHHSNFSEQSTQSADPSCESISSSGSKRISFAERISKFMKRCQKSKKSNV